VNPVGSEHREQLKEVPVPFPVGDLSFTPRRYGTQAVQRWNQD
jgi:hypothetical protein